MLKLLIKKQLMEVFRSYFYDTKKNKTRSKKAVAGYFIFFAALMIIILGGMFTFLSFSMCGGLASAGVGWLYFAIMGLLSVFLGVFGSVFNTFSSLYKAKDNDLLLSMPIPPKYIILSRLFNVYLLGLMYSAVVIIPANIVYLCVAGFTVTAFIGGVILVLVISVVVLLLSCLLGWVVAKLSGKLKSKSIITVFISLFGIAAYYFIYFKAMNIVSELLANAAFYGSEIKSSAYWMYLFGQIGVGDLLAAVIYIAGCAVLLFAVLRLLSGSFMALVTSTDAVRKKARAHKAAKQRGMFSAVLVKEFKRLGSSANYMLNCSLGTLILPIIGIVMLIKGGTVYGILSETFAECPGCASILICVIICTVSMMNDTAVPSVSLEGRSLWIIKSLPIKPQLVLLAKLCVQVTVTALPIVFCGVCIDIVIEAPIAEKLLIVIMPVCCSLFAAVFDLFLGVKMPNLVWTNEIAPVKQSGSVLIAIFGGFIYAVLMASAYMFAAWPMGAVAYLILLCGINLLGAALMLLWIRGKGAEIFASL